MMGDVACGRYDNRRFVLSRRTTDVSFRAGENLMNTHLRAVACVSGVVVLTSAVRGQDEKVEADKLPQRVKDTLKAKFPGATVTTATKTKENNEVIYDIEMTRNGRKHEMDCKEDGTIVNFENEVAPKDLPKAVSDAVKAKYPGATIRSCMEVMITKDNKDVVEEYEIQIETADKKEVEVAVSPDGKSVQ